MSRELVIVCEVCGNTVTIPIAKNGSLLVSDPAWAGMETRITFDGREYDICGDCYTEYTDVKNRHKQQEKEEIQMLFDSKKEK